MRTIGIVKFVFTLVGAAMLLGAGVWYQSTRNFIAAAAETEGTVVELQPVRSDGSTTYRPVVQFKDPRGQTIQFSSSSSSNPPSYSPGEQVTVLYLPENPQDAKIKGYFSLWGGATIFGGLGSVFLLIGVGIIVGTRIKRQNDEALRASGMPVETDFQTVEINTSLKVNGRSPFRVVTQWQNPATGNIHVFRSNNVWFDPQKYVAGKLITVYIERGNPKKYYVDLTFLPKVAS